MNPTRLLALTAAAASLAAALPAHAAGARPRPRCDLAGPNLAGSRAIDVVRRDYAEGQRLLGCVRPFGRVRVIADAPDMGIGEGVARLLRVAGTWVAASEAASNQYGGGSELIVVDVRSGRGYRLFAQGSVVGQPPSSPQLSAWAINPRGFAATVLDELDPERRPGATPRVVARRLVLHTPRGLRRQLDVTFAPDDLDPASLVLDHRTVLWTYRGEVRYARF